MVCSVGEGWQSPEICQRFAERAELGAFSPTPGNALQDHIEMAEYCNTYTSTYHSDLDIVISAKYELSF